MKLRRVVRGCLTGAALSCVGSILPLSQLIAQPAGEVRLTLLLPSVAGAGSADFHRGAQMGAEEANRAATLLGRTVRLDVVDMATIAPAQGAASLPDASAVREVAAVTDFLLAAVDCNDIGTALRKFRGAAFPVLNLGCADDALRTSCGDNVFHLVPSASMQRDAAAMPGSGTRERAAQVLAWHPELHRFGAEQLNDRYEARFGTGMNSEAWLGWMAAKVAWEVAARARTGESVLDRLAAGRDRFDGHKGVPLDFRKWDRQLRQPMYLVENGGADGVRITDLPPRDGADVRTTLDRIGRGEAETTCPSPR